MTLTTNVVAPLLILVSTAAMAPSAPAQHVKPNAEIHDGVWLSVGLGVGTLRNAAAYNTRNPYAGGSLHAAAGAAVSQRILLGLEFDRWGGAGAADGASHQTVHFVTAGTRLYPSDTAGFWLRLGAGATWSREQQQQYSGRGAAVAAGAGYDFGLTPESSWHIEMIWLVGVAGRGTLAGDSRPANPVVTVLRVGYTTH